MAKRGKPQARRQGAKGTPGWAWLLVGLLVGILGYFGYQQYQALSAPESDATPLPGKDKAGGKGKASEPPASGMDDDGVLDTDYSFYDVLPTQETVDAPEAEAGAEPSDAPKPGEDPQAKKSETPAAKPEQPVAAATPDTSPAAEPERYMLQAGSFERSADADDLKARIALSGEPARVEQAEVNGKTMYRVRLGPYENAQSANTAKANLAGQGIQADRIKIK
jgi:cell division septation protein DedD